MAVTKEMTLVRFEDVEAYREARALARAVYGVTDGQPMRRDPILIAAVGRPLGWGAHFVRYIVAFNWSSVYVIGVMLPPLMLFDAGVSGGNTVGFLGLAAMAAALWMRWIVAVTGLQVSGLAAAGIVVAEILLSIGANWLF